MARSIQSIVINGYKSIGEAALELGDLTVLIGPNGAGKSNFISVFEWLGRIADEQLRLEVGKAGGASALLPVDAPQDAYLRFMVDGGGARYEVVLERSSNDELFFQKELVGLWDKDGGLAAEFELGVGHRESKLSSTQDEATDRAFAWARRILQGCRVHHFQDTTMSAAVKLAGYTSDDISLHRDASNLAPFLMSLKEQSPTAYRRILRTIRAVAPFLEDFVLVEEGSGRVRLRWRQQGADAVLGVEALSDGTLRFICLATLLLQPSPPELLVLDEPELGLHPVAIVHLAEMLRAAAVGSQVIVATQSVTLLDQMSLDDVVVVERRAGQSKFRRLEEDALRGWLDDYSLGELWQKNLLGGQPDRERAETGR